MVGVVATGCTWSTSQRREKNSHTHAGGVTWCCSIMHTLPELLSYSSDMHLCVCVRFRVCVSVSVCVIRGTAVSSCMKLRWLHIPVVPETCLYLFHTQQEGMTPPSFPPSPSPPSTSTRTPSSSFKHNIGLQHVLQSGSYHKPRWDRPCLIYYTCIRTFILHCKKPWAPSRLNERTQRVYVCVCICVCAFVFVCIWACESLNN
jgi:hypothetical protein